MKALTYRILANLKKVKDRKSISMATIYDVSRLAGVSLATVSRVMNKNTRVNDKTKTKVLDAIAQLRYRPNTIAKSLASNRRSPSKPMGWLS